VKTQLTSFCLTALLSSLNCLTVYAQTIKNQDDYNRLCSKEAHYYNIQSPDCDKFKNTTSTDEKLNSSTNSENSNIEKHDSTANASSNPVNNSRKPLVFDRSRINNQQPKTEPPSQATVANETEQSTQKVVINEVVIPDGKEIVVVTTERLSSGKLMKGSLITFQVVSDITVDGKVVIKAGTIARGTVTEARRNGLVGKGGRLNITVDSTTAIDGQKINLRASHASDGQGSVGASIAVGVIFTPLAFLFKGNNAVIKAGTQITAYIDGETHVAMK
jgi:hypothetical protein